MGHRESVWRQFAKKGTLYRREQKHTSTAHLYTMLPVPFGRMWYKKQCSASVRKKGTSYRREQKTHERIVKALCTGRSQKAKQKGGDSRPSRQQNDGDWHVAEKHADAADRTHPPITRYPGLNSTRV